MRKCIFSWQLFKRSTNNLQYRNFIPAFKLGIECLYTDNNLIQPYPIQFNSKDKLHHWVVLNALYENKFVIYNLSLLLVPILRSEKKMVIYPLYLSLSTSSSSSSFSYISYNVLYRISMVLRLERDFGQENKSEKGVMDHKD